MFWKRKPISNKAAVTLIKISEFFSNTMLVISIATVLYQSKGVSIGDFFLIQGLCQFAVFVMEIPSGYMADRFSRKKVLFFGTLLSCLAYVELYFAFNFWTVLLSEIMMGFACALSSGTLEAYVYDLLKRDKKEKTFLKEYGAITTYGLFSTFIGSIVGGALYAAMGNGLVALQAAAIAVGVVCIAMLPELTEVRRKVSKRTNPLKDIAGIITMTVKHPELKWFMTFPAVFGAFTVILFWGLQPMMKTVGVATALFGIIFGINRCARMTFARYAHKIYDWLGMRRLFSFLLGILAIALMSGIIVLNIHTMWVIYILCALIAIIMSSQVLAYLVFNTLIHHRIKSTERGTVLSINSMYNSLFSGAVMVLMKPLMDGIGLESTFIILLLLLPLMFILVYKILKMNIK